MTDTTAAPPGAQRTTAYAWVVLGMLGFIYIFNFLDRQLMSVLIESIKKDPAFATTLPDGTTVGLTDAQMGWMTGFWFALVYTVLGVVVGFMADRTSRRNILYAGATLWSAFTAACGLAQNYPTLLAARMGVGVGEAAGAPPSYSIISDYFPAEKRGLALAIFSMGVPLGQAAAIAFGAQPAFDEVQVEGIDKIEAMDITLANKFDYRIKLVAEAFRVSNGKDGGGARCRVAPVLVSKDHPLASVNGPLNAVVVEGEPVGRLTFTGPGAGSGQSRDCRPAPSSPPAARWP